MRSKSNKLRVLVTTEDIPGTECEFGTLSREVTHLAFEARAGMLCGRYRNRAWHFVGNKTKVTCRKCRQIAKEFKCEVGKEPPLVV